MEPMPSPLASVPLQGELDLQITAELEQDFPEKVGP
jgi:hypothetical protein